MTLSLLITLIIIHLISWISIKKAITSSVSDRSKLIKQANEIDEKNKIIQSINTDLKVSTDTLLKTEQERERAVLLSHSLGEQLNILRRHCTLKLSWTIYLSGLRVANYK